MLALMPARGQRYLRNRGEKFKSGQYQRAPNAAPLRRIG
jgi:hypothetical protein